MGNGGPRTAAGKALAARNAISYGIFAATPVIPGVESEDDWLRHRDGIIGDLAPEGELEHALAACVAALLWRLPRVLRFERDAILGNLTYARKVAAIYARRSPPDPQDDDSDHRGGQHLLPGGHELDRVVRYEAHLGRQLTSSLHELEALQARRCGQPAPLLRVDVAAQE